MNAITADAAHHLVAQWLGIARVLEQAGCKDCPVGGDVAGAYRTCAADVRRLLYGLDPAEARAPDA